MKTLLLILAILAMASLGWAADINLSWDVVAGVTGYKVYTSTDGGTTWGLAWTWAMSLQGS